MYDYMLHYYSIFLPEKQKYAITFAHRTKSRLHGATSGRKLFVLSHRFSF